MEARFTFRRLSYPSPLVTTPGGGYNLPQMHQRILCPGLALIIGFVLSLSGCAIVTKAPPVANAGPDLVVHAGETVSFDGSSSVDLDGGQIVYYHWRTTAAPEGRETEVDRVLREGENAALWTSDSPIGAEDLGEWVIELTVTDDEGQSATDDMKLFVVP